MIYLDNSATTSCFDEAVDIMTEALKDNFGNPSSLHNMGTKGKDYLKIARKQIGATLGLKVKNPNDERKLESSIVFVSGGTEGNNLAIKGVCERRQGRGKHIITTKIEHASVLNTFKYLENHGFDVTYLGTDNYGVISLDELKSAIRDDTILVSIMMVNNEIGSIQPISEAGKLIKSINENTVFHVDAVQAYGKMPINPVEMNIDLLTVSGHKIHGPKGSGFVYMRDNLLVAPQIIGGGHENGMRSGTENVPAIAGLGVAAKLCFENLEANIKHMYELRNRFINGIKDIEHVSINGHLDEANAPHIVSVSIDGNRTKAQVILNALQSKDIYVSAGSACSSNKPGISETLKAIGLDKKLLEKTIRFSFCPENTFEEIDAAVAALKEIVPLMVL